MTNDGSALLVQLLQVKVFDKLGEGTRTSDFLHVKQIWVSAELQEEE
jgi:hypothetical protein